MPYSQSGLFSFSVFRKIAVLVVRPQFLFVACIFGFGCSFFVVTSFYFSSSAELKSSSRGSSITIAKAYTFVEDRLRAVRQDLTVQGLAVVPEAAEVLKTAANFYVVAGYLVCEEVRNETTEGCGLKGWGWKSKVEIIDRNLEGSQY